MPNWIQRLVYRKWFFGFLALVLWADCWTDLVVVMDAARPIGIFSLILSVTAAVLATLVFLDLHLRRPSPGQ